MNYGDWLKTADEQLTAAGITTGRLEALVLLEDATGQDRAWLLVHVTTELNDNHIATLNAELQRRLQHEPLAYIREKSEFYGREFFINERVLEPRPESETMIEVLKRLVPAESWIADIGTGSGALAITGQLEIPRVKVAAVDIDEACLAVAERNAITHATPIQFMCGNLLEPFLQKSCNFEPSVLMANLPYVPTDYPINEAAKHEPPQALFGGTDGLDLYRTMFAQSEQLKTRPTLILTESLPEQHDALAAIARQHGYNLHLTEDFIQAFGI